MIAGAGKLEICRASHTPREELVTALSPKAVSLEAEFLLPQETSVFSLKSFLQLIG